jgi:starch-binding outer membrane protein, SusD/RagB family
MKNIKLYIITVLAVFIATSCSLDRFPESDLSDISFWGSDDNFMQACNTLYTLVDGEEIRFDDNRSDFGFQFGSSNAVSSGTWIVPATSDTWDNPYKMIFDANKIIEKATIADVAKVKSITRWEGEAKFWRAYAYIKLVAKYGDVPLILKTLDINDPELYDGRTDRATVVSQIYSDLDFAAENLPAFTQLGSSGYGRVSKSAAQALKARVALYEGTRQKFHGYGQPNSNLSVAISAAEAVMASGHQLYTAKPYFNLFQYDGEGSTNKEIILSVVYGVNTANAIRFHNITRKTENGTSNVTRPMILQYLCTDGLPYDKSPLAEKPESGPLSIFKNKDPRMGASIFKQGDAYNNPDLFPLIPSAYIPTGFNSRKYYVPADWANNRSYIDISVIRYAEILLIYAEAKFEMNGSISDADLDKSINQLRDRVGMPHLTNAFVTSNGLDMRSEIRRERNVELAQEGFRYDDINRWKIAENVLPKEMVGATYFPVYGSAVVVSTDGYFLAQTANTRHFDPKRDYLYPVPTREISLSNGMVKQNPGW